MKTKSEPLTEMSWISSVLCAMDFVQEGEVYHLGGDALYSGIPDCHSFVLITLQPYK